MLGNIIITNAIREAQLVEERTRREAERNAAVAADKKDYNLSPESLAALERGDRQRETGVYNGHIQHECVSREDDVCNARGYCECECGARREWDANAPDPTARWE